MNADSAIRIIEPPPSRGQLLYDGIRSLRKPKLEAAPPLPAERLVRPAVELQAGDIARYAQACGFRREHGVPLAFPHTLAFPLHLLLLTHRRFPYPASGMVHLANRIRQYQKLEEGQALRLEVFAERWLALLDNLPADAPRGIEFPLTGHDLTAVTRRYVNLLRED